MTALQPSQEGEQGMKHQGIPALLVVGGVLAAVFRPAAQARPTCQEFDDTTICETTGSVSIKGRA